MVQTAPSCATKGRVCRFRANLTQPRCFGLYSLLLIRSTRRSIRRAGLQTIHLDSPRTMLFQTQTLAGHRAVVYFVYFQDIIKDPAAPLFTLRHPGRPWHLSHSQTLVISTITFFGPAETIYILKNRLPLSNFEK
ncbi:hypothetical protein LMH87_011273 [Akanthomyces muscarius]|uniref:Uncharacterized protein n=1 Tax=Akanthomyces muscarius TaxID=2231603 RepID=A0A9W8QAC1_AKAMU|nr:hypothetical protein LMH87_011273 [Akanthomyces muscarius]KAJ4150526.1 hypothetical protein LMH87_011273 [Akanthomyces muscarius]